MCAAAGVNHSCQGCGVCRQLHADVPRKPRQLFATRLRPLLVQAAACGRAQAYIESAFSVLVCRLHDFARTLPPRNDSRCARRNRVCSELCYALSQVNASVCEACSAITSNIFDRSKPNVAVACAQTVWRMLLRSLSTCIKLHFQKAFEQAAHPGRSLCTGAGQTCSDTSS